MLKEYLINRASERSTLVVSLFAVTVAVTSHVFKLSLNDAFDCGASIAALFHAALPGE